jgi:5-methylcytosine-specific restriction protein A
MREVMMRDFPVCEECLKEGRTSPSQLVHHIRPWQLGRTEAEQEALMYDYDNLQCLCNDCHVKIHHGMNIAAAYEHVKR